MNDLANKGKRERDITVRNIYEKKRRERKEKKS